VRATDREMMTLRSLMRDGAPAADVARQGVLAQARDALAGPGLSPRTIFASALLILLREGIEALLVVAAIVAFLVKARRRDAHAVEEDYVGRDLADPALREAARARILEVIEAYRAR
jgi:high-affinity Fe2+/Pb2+ permease